MARTPCKSQHCDLIVYGLNSYQGLGEGPPHVSCLMEGQLVCFSENGPLCGLAAEAGYLLVAYVPACSYLCGVCQPIALNCRSKFTLRSGSACLPMPRAHLHLCTVSVSSQRPCTGPNLYTYSYFPRLIALLTLPHWKHSTSGLVAWKKSK